MEQVRQAHIDNAIDNLNAIVGAPPITADEWAGRYTSYIAHGIYNLVRYMSPGTGRRTVLMARNKRDLLTQIEAYTQGVRDTRQELGDK